MEGLEERAMPPMIPVTAWHPRDQAAWAVALAQGNVLDGRGAAAQWRRPSIRKVTWSVGRFLGWASEVQSLALAPAPELATKEILRAYVSWLEPRVSPVTTLGLIVDLSEFVRVAWPETDRALLMRLETRLRWRAVPQKDKRPRLRATSELAALGEHLMQTMMETSFADPRLPFARYRDGLAIALLALCPIRIRAFASLQLGEHIFRKGETWKVLVTRELSKTHRPQELSIPAPLVPAVERYLREIRPALLEFRGRWYRDPGDAFWISVDGSPLTPKALGNAITMRTREAFGLAMSPHYFRDCAATTLALESPGDIGIAAALLGHADPRTTEAHYNQAGSVDAGRKHLSALRALRRQPRQRS